MKYRDFCLEDEIAKYPGKPIVSRQCYLVLFWLEYFGSITQREADYELGVMRLSARIHEIRKKMHIEFEDEMVRGTNRFGWPTHYKRYKRVE